MAFLATRRVTKQVLGQSDQKQLELKGFSNDEAS
jgi:hypothetical protein